MPKKQPLHPFQEQIQQLKDAGLTRIRAPVDFGRRIPNTKRENCPDKDSAIIGRLRDGVESMSTLFPRTQLRTDECIISGKLIPDEKMLQQLAANYLTVPANDDGPLLKKHEYAKARYGDEVISREHFLKLGRAYITQNIKVAPDSTTEDPAANQGGVKTPQRGLEKWKKELDNTNPLAVMIFKMLEYEGILEDKSGGVTALKYLAEEELDLSKILKGKNKNAIVKSPEKYYDHIANIFKESFLHIQPIQLRMINRAIHALSSVEKQKSAITEQEVNRVMDLANTIASWCPHNGGLRHVAFRRTYNKLSTKFSNPGINLIGAIGKTQDRTAEQRFVADKKTQFAVHLESLIACAGGMGESGMNQEQQDIAKKIMNQEIWKEYADACDMINDRSKKSALEDSVFHILEDLLDKVNADAAERESIFDLQDAINKEYQKPGNNVLGQINAGKPQSTFRLP